MSRVRRVGIDPSRPESVVDQVNEILFEADGKLSFGEPLDPNDPTSVVLAGGVGGTAHNGTRSNIWGSWVELEFTALDTEVVCNHNLYLDQPGGYTTEPVAGSPNCRWFVVGWQHDGTTKTLWDDLRTPVDATHKSTFPPVWGATGAAPFNANLPIWWFEDEAVNEDQVYFTVQLPHNYKEGTNIVGHVHWIPEANASGPNECVKWGLEYTWANMGSTFPASTLIYTNATSDATQTIQAEQLVASRHYVSVFTVDVADAAAVINGTEPKTISSMLVCRLFRNSTDVHDTYTALDAGLLEVDFHYEVDGFGSDTANIKTADVELEWNPQSIRYQAGDTITANSIGLRAYAGPGLLVDNSHKLKVTLFFIKASR